MKWVWFWFFFRQCTNGIWHQCLYVRQRAVAVSSNTFTHFPLLFCFVSFIFSNFLPTLLIYFHLLPNLKVFSGFFSLGKIKIKISMQTRFNGFKEKVEKIHFFNCTKSAFQWKSYNERKRNFDLTTKYEMVLNYESKKKIWAMHRFLFWNLMKTKWPARMS